MSPVRRGGLPEEIAAYLRSQILGGALKPGEKLDQDRICDELDVSRSPLREAIVVLGGEGLLDVTPRRGAQVAQLTRDDVVDHYELFGLVSGRVAAMAAEAFDDEDMVELRSLHDRFASAAADDHAALNEEFHRLINRVAPRRTRWLLRSLERSIPELFYTYTPGWNDQAVHDHEAIVDAICGRDGDKARLAMETHLHRAGVAAADALEANGFWEDQ